MKTNRYVTQMLAYAALAVAVAGSLTLTSCGDNRHDVPEPPKPVEETGRTVVVYMLASDNGLGSAAPYDYDIQDIDEMAEAARKGDIRDGRLIVFHSSSNGRQVLKEVLPDGSIDTLKVYDATTRPQAAARMTEVLDDVKSLSPARDYGLVLWGHGTGWLEDGIAETVVPERDSYSYGHESYDRYKMNVTTLGRVLEGRGFSFVYFDCCYMASVEVMYELRHVAPEMVVYSTEVLAYGMPYQDNVKHFFAPRPDMKAAARATFDFYDVQLNPRYRMCTVSVINTLGLERLAAATRAIYERNTTGIPDGYTPQHFKTNRPYYYFDFGGYVNAMSMNGDERDEFNAAMAETVELKLATERIWNELDIREHSGLSTFIMESDASTTVKNYEGLSWYRDVASALVKE